MLFWAIAILMGAATAALVAWPLLRKSASRAGNPNIAVFKDQLAEIESDLARGVLTEAEAEALRVEVSRRLLAAADAGDAARSEAPARLNGAILVIVSLLVLGGGTAAYFAVGAPGMPDQPLVERLRLNAELYAQRPTQAEMRAELEASGGLAPPPEIPAEQAELMDRLRKILETRTDDLQGHQLLAVNLARLQDWHGAAEAQGEVMRILGEDAGTDDFADLAEFQILAVNGYVSPEAEAALRRSLELDPRNPRARYYSGLSAIQAGRADIAYDLWTRLLAESRPEAPWVRAIASQITDVALAAGRSVPPIPSAGPGPAAADIEAAGDMTPEERQEMIRGMVARLSDRLATEGGPAEDWARLIRAYGVLGERARASDIWNEAQEVFADSPADLALLRQAAQDAEVAQ